MSIDLLDCPISESLFEIIEVLKLFVKEANATGDGTGLMMAFRPILPQMEVGGINSEAYYARRWI